MFAITYLRNAQTGEVLFDQYGYPLVGVDNGASFYNNGGVLSFSAAIQATGWPTDPTGLPPGAVYNNGLIVCIVPGFQTIPFAPAFFFDSVTPSVLLLIGGAGLPTDVTQTSPLELWNNGNVVCVA